MIKYEDRKAKLNRHYRKVEAMVRQGYDVTDILKECPELDKIDVLDIDQKIFAREMMKKERLERYSRY